MKSSRQMQAGFTLVELMVVAIIVAILAAVAIPMMSGSTKRAMATEAETAIGTIVTQARIYLNEHGTYPVDLTNITSIASGTLDGQYFNHGDYEFAGAGLTFTARCEGKVGKTAGMSVTFTHEGKWDRNY